MLHNKLFNNVLKDFNTGYWEINPATSQEYWSPKFYRNLGYRGEDIQPDINYFLEHLIHPDDRDFFRNNFFNYQKHNVNFIQHINILNANGEYSTFKCTTNEELPIKLKSETLFLFFFEIKSKQDNTIQKNHFFYQETAQMTATGSWHVDFEKKESYWDYETYRILEYPTDYKPSIKESTRYYDEEHRQLAADCFFNCSISGKPFSIEIKMQTAKGRSFWAKAMGKPVYNEHKKIVGIRGVFQDIDDAKTKEIKLQKSLDIIASQNSKLFNFAHIVSHNLRSHTSNLSLLVQLIEGIDDPEEKNELITEFKTISSNLNTTIEHLNEIVTIHTNNKQQKVAVKLENALQLVINGIGHMISKNHAEIQTDFEAFDTIEYIPAYIESILLNLITNAIKYKHPDRPPIIHIKTYIKNSKKHMQISDNGIGINLDLFKDKMFGMYKTFHQNEDAVGIGLFLTKNQIESLNGTIEVDSMVDKGTSFTIKF